MKFVRFSPTYFCKTYTLFSLLFAYFTENRKLERQFYQSFGVHSFCRTKIYWNQLAIFKSIRYYCTKSFFFQLVFTPIFRGQSIRKALKVSSPNVSDECKKLIVNYLTQISLHAHHHHGRWNKNKKSFSSLLLIVSGDITNAKFSSISCSSTSFFRCFFRPNSVIFLRNSCKLTGNFADFSNQFR